MSNILASQRHPTKIEFFDKAIDLRAKIVYYISLDLRPNGEDPGRDYVVSKVCDSIYDTAQDLIYCITQAYNIYITTTYEFNERRRYMTKAIGDLEFIIQEIQFVIRSYNIKISKYCKLIDEIVVCEDAIKEWRKQDNKIKRKLELQKSEKATSDT